MQDFINDEAIQVTLDKAKSPSRKRVEEIITKAGELKGLSLDEVAILLQTEDPELIGEIHRTARYIKQAIYGNRLVLFAPLYISNYCSNNCMYCGFRKDNKELKRTSLTIDEIVEEVKILEQEGHKRLLMLYGEEIGRAHV
jgi:2-iminoacetate synthase